MRYYITADIHGFYTEFHKALDEAGYFTDPEPHKLIILGDIFDRGQEAVQMQRFILYSGAGRRDPGPREV